MKKKLFLQLFAEAADGGTGTEETGGAEQGGTDGADGTEGEKEQPASDKKYSDEDLDRIIGKKLAEWHKKQEKAVKEAEKLASMNATQRAEHERDKLQERIDELERKEALATMTKEARNMLAAEGVNASDELLSMIVADDAESTKAAVESFSKLFKEEVENAVKKRLAGETPRAGSGTPPTVISEIDKRIKKYT